MLDRKTWLFVLLLSLLCNFAFVEAQDAQQTKVVSHWSPYNYPSELPENTRIHIVEKNDTLWHLAQSYYQNPLVWPQIAAANAYILNPNLIYPGDPIVLPDLNIIEPGRVRSAENQTAENEESSSDSPAEVPVKDGMPFSLDQRVMFEVEPQQSIQYSPAAGTFEMYCCPTVYGEKIEPELWIAGTEEDRQLDVQPYDLVYVNRGVGHVKVGEYYVAMNYARPVHRISDNKYIGQGYYEVGLIKIHLVAEEFAVAEVISSCDGLKVGSILKPYKKLPMPIVEDFNRFDIPKRYARWTDEDSSEIVFTHYETLMNSTSDLIVVERTPTHQYLPGDLVVFFERSKLTRLYSEYKTPKWEDPDGEEIQRKGYPRSKYHIAHVEGVGVVLKTTDVAALVKITYSARDFKPGDVTTAYSNTIESESGR
jgi:LysM repeat protein